MDKKKIILTFAIAVIFVFFIGYGIEVFHDTPEYKDFCPEVYDINNEKDCLAAGGEWFNDESSVIKNEPIPANENAPVKGRFCHNKHDCNKGFNDLNDRHDLVVFIVSIIIGLIAIGFGIYLKKDAISTGVLAGGVLLLLYGTIRYWRHADDILKFILLGIALAVLIWLGYKKFDKR